MSSFFNQPLDAIIEKVSAPRLHEGERGCPVRLSAGLTCMRRLGLEAMLETDGVEAGDGTLTRIFSRGHMIGAWWASAFNGIKEQIGADRCQAEKEHWLKLECNYKDGLEANGRMADVGIHQSGDGLCLMVMDPEDESGAEGVYVRGHSDLILTRYEAEGVPESVVIIDFKTIKEGFKRRDGTGFGFVAIDPGDYRTVSEPYIAQIGAYCLAWAEEHPESRDALCNPIIVYECKDNQEVKCVEIPLQVALDAGAHVRWRLSRLVESIARGELPEPEYRPPDWQCNYCPVALACWGDKIRDTQPGKRIPKYQLIG